MRTLPLLLIALSLLACGGGGSEEAPPAEWGIVFFSDRSGDGDLFAVRSDLPGPQRLTAHPSAEYRPLWVDPMEKIVFVSDADDPPSLRIQDETDLGELLQAENPGGDMPPAWSPDGEWICYSDPTLGNVDLWIARPDGSEARRLTDSPGVDDQPAWSPDGSWIAYRSRVTHEDGMDSSDDIYVTSPLGGEKINVTNTPGVNEAHPDWLPDGDHLLCDSDDTEDGQPDIFRVRVEDGQQQNLTRHAGPDLDARMRPDGGRIVFVSLRSGSWEVWSMAPDGSDAVQVTDGPGYDGQPVWVPASALP